MIGLNIRLFQGIETGQGSRGSRRFALCICDVPKGFEEVAGDRWLSSSFL